MNKNFHERSLFPFLRIPVTNKWQNLELSQYKGSDYAYASFVQNKKKLQK